MASSVTSGRTGSPGIDDDAGCRRLTSRAGGFPKSDWIQLRRGIVGSWGVKGGKSGAGSLARLWTQGLPAFST
jgi:hypothetical protein